MEKHLETEDYYYPMSIGANCLIAHHLQQFGLRREAYPFDWIFIPSCNVFNYLTKQLKNNFSDFLTDLQYDDDKYVELLNYPGTKFMHHDFIEDQKTTGELTAKMMERADRFMNKMKEKNPFFLCSYERFYSEIPDAEVDFAQSIMRFKDELNRQGITNYEIMLIVYDNEDFTLDKVFEKSLINIGVHVRKFVRDTSVDSDYGHEKDFAPILDEFFTI